MKQNLSKKNLNNKIHFIGIAGTAMASLARAFKVAGFEVTGSDSEHVFPPMSTYLKNNKIKYYAPFSREKLETIVGGKVTGSPDSKRPKKSLGMTSGLEIVIGNAHYSETNPEVVYARNNKIELEHFPKLIEKYLIKKNSVVVTGTYGKTSTTAMLAWLFFKANKNPNYMLGGIPINLKHGANLTRSNWSVVEGDEYPAASPWDFSPKFDFYQPQYLVLSSAEWDHMDIYKTKKSYMGVFKKLVARVPKNGLILAKLNGENLNEVLKKAKCPVVHYTKDRIRVLKDYRNKEKKVYNISDVKVNGKTTEFNLNKNEKFIGKFTTQLLGEFNLENWCAALALCLELKIDLNILQKAVRQFKGVKRRLEIRAQKNNITIIDDFAHNPSKARESILALKKHFPNKKIYIIFEPNRGGRSINCMQAYNNVFKGVDKIFIPKLSNYKPKEGVIDVSGKELATHLKKTHKNVLYVGDNEKILAWLNTHAKPGTVIAFLGSRDFGGMIEKVTKNI
ncbi:MAG TPA: Mur ligase family protein [bacterium]|nr:Mur ligase family protein [bacterium]